MKFRVLKAWSQDQGANRVDFFWALLLHCGSIFSSYKASSPFGWKPYIYDVSKLNQPLKVLSTITLWEARGLDFKRTGVLIRTKLCPLPNQLTPPLLSIIYVKYACICNLSAIYLSVYLSVYLPIWPFAHLSFHLSSIYWLYLFCLWLPKFWWIYSFSKIFHFTSSKHWKTSVALFSSFFVIICVEDWIILPIIHALPLSCDFIVHQSGQTAYVHSTGSELDNRTHFSF